MVGGYQTLNLKGATAGDPVAIKGAYNTVKNANGKPMLIKGYDGQDVFAQAKEVNGDYVITYLSAEGKTVKVAITDEDAVTTVIADDAAHIEQLEIAVNEINARVDAYTQGDGVNITSYDSSSNTFTVPEDGYLALVAAAVDGNYISVNMGQFYTTAVASGTASNVITSVFVKKGTEVYINDSAGNGNYVYYYSLS